MKAKEVAMVIAVAILSALFVGLLVDAIYQEPQYDSFCKYGMYTKPMYAPPTHECPQMNNSEQSKANACYDQKAEPDFNTDQYGCQTTFKGCNTCNRDFGDAVKVYNRNVFFIITPIGIAAILAGLFLSFEVIGTGLMFSGILLVAYGTIRYFSEMSKIFRVGIIFIELALLIVISIKKLKK